MDRLRRYIMSVKFGDTEMAELENIVSSFFEKRDIKLKPPVDIFALATQLGFDVRAVQFPDPLEGMLIVDESVRIVGNFNSNKVILFDVNSDIYKAKFIVGHELGHYIEKKQQECGDGEDKDIVLAARDHSVDYSSDKNEQRKDYIAAALLVPREDLLNRFSSTYEQVKDNLVKLAEFCRELAKFYRVEEILAQRRIEEVLHG